MMIIFIMKTRPGFKAAFKQQETDLTSFGLVLEPLNLFKPLGCLENYRAWWFRRPLRKIYDTPRWYLMIIFWRSYFIVLVGSCWNGKRWPNKCQQIPPTGEAAGMWNGWSTEDHGDGHGVSVVRQISVICPFPTKLGTTPVLHFGVFTPLKNMRVMLRSHNHPIFGAENQSTKQSHRFTNEIQLGFARGPLPKKTTHTIDVIDSPWFPKWCMKFPVEFCHFKSPSTNP